MWLRSARPDGSPVPPDKLKPKTPFSSMFGYKGCTGIFCGTTLCLPWVQLQLWVMRAFECNGYSLQAHPSASLQSAAWVLQQLPNRMGSARHVCLAMPANCARQLCSFGQTTRTKCVEAAFDAVRLRVPAAAGTGFALFVAPM